MYLIPQPKELNLTKGRLVLGIHNAIVLTNGTDSAVVRMAARKLQSALRDYAGLELEIIAGVPADKDIIFARKDLAREQAYELELNDGGCLLKGSESGMFYAAMTLVQMIEQCGAVLPYGRIVDAPDMENRGYYLDQSRGRVLKLEELKACVDRLCRYKINQFQLYVEHTYLFRGFSELWREETPLTAEEIMELDEYCRLRQIELIPSLSSFGHLYTLLGTKQCESLCELEHSSEQPFSLVDRMRHHTVNVSNPQSLELILNRIREYMALFSSDKFNICADETFDLGKGKSQKQAAAQGVHQLYIHFVRELCEFLVREGKTPMFWGDVLWDAPELIRELPAETICLNWGYIPDQREHETKVMAEAGARQYLCPGVCGWNQWMNLMENAYRNICTMCHHARKYGALGILNTDWGDFGHINHPWYSIPGMIYGAAFSWNGSPIAYEQINREISRLHYGDCSESLVGLMGQISDCELFPWRSVVTFYEKSALDQVNLDDAGVFQNERASDLKESEILLSDLYTKIAELICHMERDQRKLFQSLAITIEGVRTWNQVGRILAQEGNHIWDPERTAASLRSGADTARELELWFHQYQKDWRSICREGNLDRIREIVFWYADLLRGRKRKAKFSHELDQKRKKNEPE